MEKQQITELKNKPVAELEKMSRELREKYRGLLFDLAAGKVKNEAALRGAKKDIARVETFLTMARRTKDSA